MAEPKAKAEPGQRNFHLEQLQAREKNLLHKLEKRIPNFNEEGREQAKIRCERDLVEIRKLIAKAKKQ
jgi:hypothetical protein